MKGKSINPESYLTGQVKKYILFFVILSIFIFSFSIVQAEEKEFVYEISANTDNFNISQILEKIKSFFTSNVFAEEYPDRTITPDVFCAQSYSWRDCSGYRVFATNIQVCSIKKGEDIESNFINKCTPDVCFWQPKVTTFVCGAELWKIKEATLKTTVFPEGNDDWNQCLMAVNIVSGPEHTLRASSARPYCIDSNGNKNSVSIDFTNMGISSGAIKWMAELHGSILDAVGTWYGELTLTGTRPSMESFNLTGINYTTGKSETVGVGKILEICKGSQVTLKWNSSHSSKTRAFIGSPEQIIIGASGTKIFTPNVNSSNVILSVRGFAGQEYEEDFYNKGIDIKLYDCAGNAPWVSISANPNTINPGDSSTLTWSSGNVDSCQAVGNSSDWKGSKPVKGSATVTPSSTRWYDIKCIKGTTTVTDDAKVKVNGAPTGNLNVKIRLNGVEVTAPTNVSFDITGPETINVTEAPQIFSNIAIGTYIISYVSGGPPDSTFIGFSPGQSMFITANQTATIYLDFSDGAGRCNITVQALKYDCDGANPVQWTGPLSYGLLGPIILNGTAVEQTFENIPVGRYYLTSLVGGPGTYNGVTPGNPVACPSGGNVTLTMKFKDCDDHYKCNYSTGRCELCGAYSEECKYSNLSDCNMKCDVCADAHDPKANVFCWANFDSDNCVGINDNNADIPSIILYDKSTDPCGDIENCTWEVKSIQGGIQNIPNVNSCGPYPWYDETPGTYTAKLTVTDSQDSSSTDTQIFTIKNVDALTCNFAWDPDAPTVGGATSFFDQTLTPNGTTLKSWSWTFQSATPASSTSQYVQNVVFNSAISDSRSPSATHFVSYL